MPTLSEDRSTSRTRKLLDVEDGALDEAVASFACFEVALCAGWIPAWDSACITLTATFPSQGLKPLFSRSVPSCSGALAASPQASSPSTSTKEKATVRPMSGHMGRKDLSVDTVQAGSQPGTPRQSAQAGIAHVSLLGQSLRVTYAKGSVAWSHSTANSQGFFLAVQS